MRFIIFGLGAIGGTFAATLTRAGHEVIGIARGRMLEAVRSDGLLFRTPAGAERIRFAVVDGASDIVFRPDDIILLTVKSQDSAAALDSLKAAGVGAQALVCAQNGVNNERLALRLFANVYGMTVMLPADYTVPGEVAAFGTPRHGICDIGRYPGGLDDTVAALAGALGAANFATTSMAAVMRSKYAKLLENLANVLEAALGPGKVPPDIRAAVRAEAEAAYRAAGIDWQVIDDYLRRAGIMEMGTIDGASRTGGSSTQSLKRGAGSIETDYLNGEIVLLGRLHGVPTPLNATLCDIGRDLIGAGEQPGSFTVEALRQRLGLTG